jgi:tetratricopeptide (TPR) repeat protein
MEQKPKKKQPTARKLNPLAIIESFSLQNSSPLHQAQELIFDAWETPSKKARLALARRALALSPDCADAYSVLAQDAAKTLDEKLRYYEEGVEAGERALGPEGFREFAGGFWGVLETRPYMRARASLAECLWLKGERSAAIDHYQALLKLNPNDNQGLRYLLANCLLAENRLDELGELLRRYRSEVSANWLYNRALYFFRREGPGAKANRELRRSIRCNPFVPLYLLRQTKLPRSLPEFYSPGDPNEAVLYASGCQPSWDQTPYALDWLAREFESTRSSSKPPK